MVRLYVILYVLVLLLETVDIVFLNQIYQVQACLFWRGDTF